MSARANITLGFVRLFISFGILALGTDNCLAQQRGLSKPHNAGAAPSSAAVVGGPAHEITGRTAGTRFPIKPAGVWDVKNSLSSRPASSTTPSKDLASTKKSIGPKTLGGLNTADGRSPISAVRARQHSAGAVSLKR